MSTEKYEICCRAYVFFKGEEAGIEGIFRFITVKVPLENNSLYDIILSILGNWKDESILALDVGTRTELFRGRDVLRLS